jgi:hypothetical protein
MSRHCPTFDPAALHLRERRVARAAAVATTGYWQCTVDSECSRSNCGRRSAAGSFVPARDLPDRIADTCSAALR